MRRKRSIARSRGNIIRRMHRALTGRGIVPGSGRYVLAGESLDVSVIGRLVTRGADHQRPGESGCCFPSSCTRAFRTSRTS